MTGATKSARANTIIRVGACALGGALATIVIVVGAVMAACFAFGTATVGLLRILADRLPRPARTESEAPIRAGALRRTPSVSTYSPAS